jgi:hypothetical protein
MVTANCVHEKANLWRPAKDLCSGLWARRELGCTAASRFVFIVQGKPLTV